jgi:hypothetical protein
VWIPGLCHQSRLKREKRAANAARPAHIELAEYASLFRPTRCRILTFGDQYSSLIIYERSSDESWVVNSWRVNPEF